MIIIKYVPLNFKHSCLANLVGPRGESMTIMEGKGSLKPVNIKPFCVNKKIKRKEKRKGEVTCLIFRNYFIRNHSSEYFLNEI